jgi:hypothetical protein
VITVVVPVHNGGRHLRVCIESLARQDAPAGSFEVVVLDNKSTDGSLEALRLLPDSVPRRVFESDRFLEIEQSWARIRDLPDVRELMTIIGHDDAFDPQFIRVTSGAMKAEPDTKLLLTHFRLIDSDGQPIRPCRPMNSSESPAQFLGSRLTGLRDSFGTGYVFRSADYRAAGGIPSYAKLLYADDALWMTLARRSKIRIIEEQCFSYRQHPSSTQHVHDSQLTFRAFSEYWQFVEHEAGCDPAIARAMKTYGPQYLRAIASWWLLEESNQANRANEPIGGDIVDGWRRIFLRSFTLTDDACGPDPQELAFSLWANETSTRRRLWRNRPLRRLLRMAHRQSQGR